MTPRLRVVAFAEVGVVHRAVVGRLAVDGAVVAGQLRLEPAEVKSLWANRKNTLVGKRTVAKPGRAEEVDEMYLVAAARLLDQPGEHHSPGDGLDGGR